MTLVHMAAGYRHSCALLRLRIRDLQEARKKAGPAERAELEQRIRDLNTLYRDTSEVARVLEHYYDRRYRKDEHYTF